MSVKSSDKPVIITAKDVDAHGGVCCPPNDQQVWDKHPRVYMLVKDKQEVVCPYCSAEYIYK